MIRSALIRKIIIGVTPGIAVALLAVGGATAAQASTQSASHGAAAASAAAAAVPMSDIADCKAADPTRSYICWWVGANMTGKMHPVRDAISNWTTQKEPTCAGGTWNDCASTLYNDNASYGAFFFYSANDSGSNFCMPPGTYAGNLTQYYYAGSAIPVNDTISSNSWDTDGCVTS